MLPSVDNSYQFMQIGTQWAELYWSVFGQECEYSGSIDSIQS